MKLTSFKSPSYKRTISVFILSLFGFLVVNLAVAAWTPPSNDPPNSNTLEPLDISNRAQTKQGNVGIGATASAVHKLNVGGSINATTSLCINDECYTDLDRLWNSTVNGVDMFNISLGRVGIGLVSPGAQVDIATEGETADDDILLRVSKRLANEMTSEVLAVTGDGVTTARQVHIHNIYGALQEGWRQYQDESSGNFNLAYIYQNTAGSLASKNILTIVPFNPDDEVSDPKEGNVGINYTYPTEHLQVAGSSSKAGAVAISPGSSNSGYGFYRTGILKFLSNDNESTDFWSGIEGYRNGYSDDTELRFYTEENGDGVGAPSQRMVIKGNGNVGIGTADPLYSLDVTGNLNASQVCINGDCEAAWPVASELWSVNGSNIYRSTGSVGIGTSNPGAGLQIATASGSWGAHLKFTRPALSSTIDTRFAASYDGLIIRNFDASASMMFSFRDYNDVHIWDMAAGGRSLFNGASDDNVSSVQIGGTDSLDVEGKTKIMGAVGIGSAPLNPTTDAFVSINKDDSTISTRLRIADTDTGGNPEIQLKYGTTTNQHWGLYVNKASNNDLIFWNTDNKFAFTTAGKLGVGTTTPADMLHVVGGNIRLANNYGVSTVSSNGTPLNLLKITSSDNLFFGPSVAGSDTYISGGDGTANKYIVIKSTGAVGINVATPQSKLDVEGGMAVGANYSGTNAAPANGMIVEGSVGIGITPPATKLDVRGNIYLSAADHSTVETLGFATNASAYHQITSNRQTGEFAVKAGVGGSGHFLTFATNDGTEKMRIATTGNVGIGTNNPSSKLHVETLTGGVQMTLKSADTTTGGASVKYVKSTTGAVREWWTGVGVQSSNDPGLSIYDATGSATRMYFKTDGNVGIGTTNPLAKLHVSAGAGNDTIIRVGNNAANNAYLYFNTNADWSVGARSDNANAFTFANSSTLGSNNRVVITTGGNVGIGTTNPFTQFEVSGAMGGVTLTRNVDGVDDEPFFLLRKGTTPTSLAQMRGIHGGGLRFTNGTSAVEWARFSPSGNFGIGTNEPGNLLSLFHESSGPIIGLSGDDTNYRGLTIYDVSESEQWFYGANNSNNFVIRRNGNADALTVNSSDGKVTVAGTLAANKIDFAQADPPYKINNTTYATYALSMIGSKEEYSAILTLTKKSGEYLATINFDNQAEGSDLWLFSKVTNLKKVFDKLMVQLTPNFSGKVWYEKVGNNKVIVHAVPDTNTTQNSLEVSLRLTAPRFDAEKWGNTREPSAVANDLDEFYKNEK